MQPDNNIYILLRFNQEIAHSKNLLENGDIWFSKISDWANDKEKGDKFETIVSYKSITPGKILTIFNESKETNIIINKGELVSTNKDIGYASSFYLLNLRDYDVDKSFKLPSHMHKYGNTCVMILNPAKFINQCKEHFKSIGLQLFYQKVKYNLPPNFENKDVFTKYSDFSPENEFRFYIPAEKIDNQLFSIGSLKTYSIILEDSTIPSLKFAPTSLYPGIEPTMFV